MKYALITGASTGIGKELAIIAAKNERNLILVARNADLLNKLKAEISVLNKKINVVVLILDLAKENSAKELFDICKKNNYSIEMLINNAGSGLNGETLVLEQDKQASMLHLNIISLFELCHLFGKKMKEDKAGYILNVGSIAGFQPGPNMSVYYATKAFVNSFTEALHEELKPYGVNCSLLAPGPTATEFAKNAGNEKSMLFKGPFVTTATSVAELGYYGLLNGMAIVIPGVLNKILVFSLRLSPRSLIRKVIYRLNLIK
ncbi:MAG: SDR family oxidoreductase [Oligoflexales bacterium]|nr:SDR family oxidoreductase [Oligoflexales bacterium]